MRGAREYSSQRHINTIKANGYSSTSGIRTNKKTPPPVAPDLGAFVNLYGAPLGVLVCASVNNKHDGGASDIEETRGSGVRMFPAKITRFLKDSNQFFFL